ncbi:MAG: peptidoglycan-binding protein, partial [Verrucomicrobiota bacterium]
QPKMPGPDSAPGKPVINQPGVPAQQPPVPQQAPAPNPYAGFFQRTPYENAPGEVQFNTLKRAQMKLARDGYYHGPIDGAPGNAISQAILRYQTESRLAGTGRLDMDTLASLDLLPHNGLSRPVYPVDPGPGRPVYRGIWVH